MNYFIVYISPLNETIFIIFELFCTSLWLTFKYLSFNDMFKNSERSLLFFDLLHVLHAGTRFSGELFPPFEIGIRWSISVASSPQYAHLRLSVPVRVFCLSLYLLTLFRVCSRCLSPSLFFSKDTSNYEKTFIFFLA